MLNKLISSIKDNGIKITVRKVFSYLRRTESVLTAHVAVETVQRKIEIGLMNAGFTKRPIWLKKRIYVPEAFSKNILIVGVTSIPQCYKYRIVQKYEYLSALGYNVYVSDYLDHLRWRSRLALVGSVIVYRLHMCDELYTIIKLCRELGINMHYDIDDPIFDIESVKSNGNLKTLHDSTVRNLIHDCDSYMSAIDNFDSIIVSTQGLKCLLESTCKGKKINVLKNGFDSISLSLNDSLTFDRKSKKKFTVCLPVGSSSHDIDTEICIDGLVKFMDQHSDVNLNIVGPSSKITALEKFGKRVNFIGFLDYSNYIELLSMANAVLLPLENSFFNKSKSFVRYIDATIAKTPVIASGVGQYLELNDGHEILFATNWHDELSMLYENKDLSNSLIKNAQRYLNENVGIEKQQCVIGNIINAQN